MRAVSDPNSPDTSKGDRHIFNKHFSYTDPKSPVRIPVATVSNEEVHGL